MTGTAELPKENAVQFLDIVLITFLVVVPTEASRQILRTNRGDVQHHQASKQSLKFPWNYPDFRVCRYVTALQDTQLRSTQMEQTVTELRCH